MSIRVSIIGSAGRHKDGEKINIGLYTRIVQHAGDQIKEIETGGKVCLVSGGAAFIDHVAVSLFLMKSVDDLTLHLPSGWDCRHSRYVGNSCCGYANYLHYQFSKKLGKPDDTSLKTLNSLIKGKPGFKYHCYNGFKARNLEVAKSDIILAYTFYNGNKPKPGSGTLHTWDNSCGDKYHFNLGEI